ncbi:MAG: aminotransferase class I/II-fold pyridoxal phosphate-dependent enzyme [Syntrophomonadaceae bacterium]|nr:aminotransferase class I/II-fold pyridoxal phosphate-dependent enzyme [Syntrophomonadaceae bacterium]
MFNSQWEAPIYKALCDYQSIAPLRLHMPGHAGGLGFETGEFKLISGFDVTEVPGLDDLHMSQEVIEEARRLLAKAYGAQESLFLVNGASSGIHALFLSFNPDDEVLVPRNAHRSFFSAMVLSAVRPIYIPVEYQPELGVALSVTGRQVDSLLAENPRVKAVFITSPSYFGTAAPIEAIAQKVHQKGIQLLVDEAHGAHFAFHAAYPTPALHCGADAAVNGMHKTLPVLNQGAALHVAEGFHDFTRLRAACSLLTTTSPSYPILASIDLARAFMVEKGESQLETAYQLARQYREKINNLPGLHCYGDELTGFEGVTGYDPLKLVVSFPGVTVSGREVAHQLREQYAIQVEMAQEKFILAMMSMFHEAAHWERFYQALKNVTAVYQGRRENTPIAKVPVNPTVLMTPRDAFMARKKQVPLKESAGCIAGESVAVYPPGIPALLPGELITEELLEYLYYIKNSKLQIQGPRESSLNSILIIDG